MTGATDSKGSRAKPRELFKRYCDYLAAFLWIAGTIGIFFVNNKSKWFWLPDILLLTGFFPILFYWRQSWPWFVFGILNILIACELAAAQTLPLKMFPAHMLPVRQHLIEHHAIVPWLFLGLVSIVYGTIRLIKNLIVWLKCKLLSAPTGKLPLP